MPIIEVEHLQKRYGDTIAVRDVSFTVEEGEIFGVLGPNGAGKTTTVQTVVGLRARDGGRVSVLDLDPASERRTLTQHVGVQLQQSELPEKLKVIEAIELYASFYAEPTDPETLIRRLGLQDKRNSRYGKLSGGQKQRLSIALALVGNPRIAVLDELTTGLDPAARRETWQLVADVRAAGVTVILVTHFMEEAEQLCDRVALIDQGRVVAVDSPAGLANRVSSEQRLRFRPSAPVDTSEIAALAPVTAVETSGEVISVTGTGDVIGAVITLLAKHSIVAEQLRVDTANLDDAFVELTRKQDR